MSTDLYQTDVGRLSPDFVRIANTNIDGPDRFYARLPWDDGVPVPASFLSLKLCDSAPNAVYFPFPNFMIDAGGIDDWLEWRRFTMELHNIPLCITVSPIEQHSFLWKMHSQVNNVCTNQMKIQWTGHRSFTQCVCGSVDLGTGVFPVGDETNLHPTLCGVEEWLGVLAVSLPWLDLRALLKSGVLAYYARRHSLDPRFERPFVSSDMRVVLSQTGWI